MGLQGPHRFRLLGHPQLLRARPPRVQRGRGPCRGIGHPYRNGPQLRELLQPYSGGRGAGTAGRGRRGPLPGAPHLRAHPPAAESPPKQVPRPMATHRPSRRSLPEDGPNPRPLLLGRGRTGKPPPFGGRWEGGIPHPSFGGAGGGYPLRPHRFHCSPRRPLRSIHRHLCILSEDYADWSAGNYLGDAANSTALAIGRLADLRGSKDSTAKRPDGQTKTGGAA